MTRQQCAVLMVLVVVSVCAGQANSQCCMPNQFTGAFGTSVGLASSQMLVIVGNMSFDMANERLAIREVHADSGTGPGNFHIINDHKGKKSYTIDLAASTCEVEDIVERLLPPCIPDNATYQATLIFGSGAETLRSHSYSFQLIVNGTWLNYNLVVQDDCVPVSGVVNGEIPGDHFLAAGSLYNVTEGIRDPSIFDVPSFCNSAHSHAPVKRHTRFALPLVYNRFFSMP